MAVTYPHRLLAVLGQKSRSFASLKELYRSVLHAAEVQDFQVCSSSSEECVLSGLHRQLSSLVRLTARCPCACWACSALSLKASCRRSFLMISMERSFRDTRILLWVPKDEDP
jgi:hypothetical protein